MKFRREVMLGVLAAGACLVPASAQALTFKRLASINGGTSQIVAETRTPDGALHLVYQAFAGTKLDGLNSLAISPSGQPGAQVHALSGWQAGLPGLVALPGGTLEAVFGAISPGNVSSVWGITSGNGGSTWSAPTDVKGGGPNESLAYASDVTAAMSGSTPILSLPQAGNIVIQKGLGPGSPSYVLNSPANGATSDANLATDAATGEVVAGWKSIQGTLHELLQGAAPTVGSAQGVPGQDRNTLIVAGRDAGPGVFAAYTPDGTHVRLLRYGGGSVAVGSHRGTLANALSVATGPKGRIWVMWGDDRGGGVAITRSNKAVTRFEPIQHLRLNSAVLWRIFGDGRLGPLDLLLDQTPPNSTSPGLYYARALPVLSARISVKKIKNKAGKVIGFRLTVHVNDAGDAVKGAHTSAKGHHGKTNSHGLSKLTVTGKPGSLARVTISAPGYHKLTKKVHL